MRPYRAIVVIDVERRRFRAETAQFVLTDKGDYQERVNTFTDNGAESCQYQPRHLAEGNGGFDLVIDKAADGKGGGAVPSELWPLLFAHGIVPTVHQPASLQRWPVSWDLEDFVPHGRHTLGGRLCQVFRTEPALGMGSVADEYWVDPTRRSAICRYVSLSSGQPWLRHDIDWAETAIGWGPEKWTLAFTANGKDVTRLTRLSVDRFELDLAVSDADFTIPAMPGMKRVIVSESPPSGVRVHLGSSGRRTYSISADGEWVELSAEGWKSLDRRTTIPLPSRWWWVPWVLGLVLCGLLIGWFLRRRWRGARALSTFR
jgi:hypothetical protein